jgi:hypothetical protein
VTPGVDHRGSRRLSTAEQWIWTLLAAATYVALSVYHKWLLNWIVGPLWLVTWVGVGPFVYDAVRSRRRPRTDEQPAPEAAS